MMYSRNFFNTFACIRENKRVMRLNSVVG